VRVKAVVFISGTTTFGVLPGTKIVELLPVTVIVEVLGAAPAAAVIVTVVLHVGLHEGAENVAVTPAGSWDSENATACVVPDRSVAVTVVDPAAPPAVTVTAPGLALKE
jgi:hypothetical protein